MRREAGASGGSMVKEKYVETEDGFLLLPHEITPGLVLENLKKKIDSGKRISVFMLSPLSQIQVKLFPYLMEVIHAVRMVCEYRYNMEFSSALLDNESNLDAYDDRQKKADRCYKADITSVRRADMVIAELSVSSTGVGHEMQEANDNGIPIIVMAQEAKKSKDYNRYLIEKYNGECESRIVYLGTGGVSLMSQGIPVVSRNVIVYERPGYWQKRLFSINDAAWKLQYGCEKGTASYEFYKKCGRWLHDFADRYDTRTLALRMLDARLQEIGFVPETVQLRQELRDIERKAGLTDADLGHLEILRRKIRKLDQMLIFNPSARHAQHDEIKSLFPEKGRNGKDVERIMTPKFNAVKKG